MSPIYLRDTQTSVPTDYNNVSSFVTKIEFDFYSVMQIRVPTVVDEILLKYVQQNTPCDRIYEMLQENKFYGQKLWVNTRFNKIEQLS